ncbi:MAG: 3-hydroxyacyl-ACP dehydratase [Bacteroidetes bacterium]|nr:3-hydroxyacyl-ACP dehydratase [Bacteroidota bacterium]
MLSNNFFNVETLTLSELALNQLQISASILLNPSHQIFKGHFPGNPVVPGVCQIQMIKELIEQAIKKTIRLTESDNIKFLLMINPLEIPRLKLDILIKTLSEKQFTAIATISYESSLFLKFKGKFENIPDITSSKIYP